MSTTEKPSTLAVQPTSKIIDANLDAALIVHESALLSRYCAEKAMSSGGTDCYKLCRVHADVSELAAKLLMSVGTESLHTKHHAPKASTVTTPSSASGTTNKEDFDRSIRHRADAHIRSLDIAGLLALAMETARRTRTICSGYTQHDHCQACAQAAGRVETVLHGLLATKKGVEQNPEHIISSPSSEERISMTEEVSGPGSVVSPQGVLPNKEPSKGQDQGLPKKLSEMGADAPSVQPGLTTAVSQEEGTRTQLREE